MACANCPCNCGELVFDSDRYYPYCSAEGMELTHRALKRFAGTPAPVLSSPAAASLSIADADLALSLEERKYDHFNHRMREI
jgi:hypothetical protein